MTSVPSLPLVASARRPAAMATYAGLGLIVALAAWLRLAPLPLEPLWLDELHTSWTVVAGPWDVAPRARLGNQSPLYFYLPWLTTQLFGQSELSLRLPSLVAGLALVPLTFAATLRFSGLRVAGLTAALLVALDEDCIFFAQEARPYAGVQVFAVLNVVCFWNLLTGPTLARRAAWVGSGAVLFYLHYTAALILVAEGLFFVGLVLTIWIRAKFPSEKHSSAALPGNSNALARLALDKFLSVLLDASLLVILCLGAAPHLAELAGRKNNWWQFIEPPTWFEAGALLPLGPNVGLPLAVVALATALRYFRGRGVGEWTTGGRAGFLAACWLLAPLAIVSLATHFQIAPLFHRRYVIGALVAALVWGASLATMIRTRRAQWAFLILLVAANIRENESLTHYLATGEWPSARHQNWRAAIEYVNQSADAQAPVFVYTGLLETSLYAHDPNPLKQEYCVLPVRGCYPLAQHLTALCFEGEHSVFQAGATRNSPPTRFWLIAVAAPDSTHLFHSGLQAPPEEIDTAGWQVAYHWRYQARNFGEIRVVRVLRGAGE